MSYQQSPYGHPPQGGPPPQQQQYGGYGAPPPNQYAPPPNQQQPQYQQYGAPPNQQYGAPPPQQQQQQRQPPPPPKAPRDPQLHGWFQAVDRDGSGHITAVELQQALVNGDWSPFDIDTVKMLMSIFDTDRSGTVGFDEFAGLWQYVKDWQNVFRHFDADRSGFIDSSELARALGQFGFNLSPRIIDLLQKKYDITDDSDNKQAGTLSQGPGEGGITFDRFVRCCVVVKSLWEGFSKIDTDRDGWAYVSYEQLLDLLLTAP